jgi:hypothetical protein
LIEVLIPASNVAVIRTSAFQYRLTVMIGPQTYFRVAVWALFSALKSEGTSVSFNRVKNEMTYKNLEI